MSMRCRGTKRLGAAAIAALAPLLTILGCVKPTMSTGDSIRTGQGLSSRYLLPKTVSLDDGSQAFCVYVARPSDDPQFFSKVEPGNTAGVEILNPMAIPQGEFLQKLRDPQLMQGAGGIGNTIANDIVTGLGTVALASAGLTVAGLAELIKRGGPKAQELRAKAVFLNAQMIEGDAVLHQSVKRNLDKLVAMMPNNSTAAERRSVKQVLGLIVESGTGDQNFLQSIVKMIVEPGNETNLRNWLNQELTRSRALGMGSRALSNDELDGVIGKLRNVFTSNNEAGRSLLQQIGVAQDASNKLAGGMASVRMHMANLAAGLSQGSVAQQGAVQTAEATLGGLERALQKEVLNDSTLHQSIGLDTSATNALGRIANGQNLSRAARLQGRGAVAGSTIVGTAAGGQGPQQAATTRLTRLVNAAPDAVDSPFARAATETADNTPAAIKRGFADIFGDTCWRGGGAATKAAKVLFCGTAAGIGSVFMKKALFDNGATMAIKREQITAALTDENGFMDVNEGTFAAVTEAIKAFTTEAETTGCQ